MSDLVQRRILHVFGCMDRGGAETRALEIMRYVDAATFEFHFCTLAGRDGALDREIEALGGTIHPVPLAPRFPWQFRRLLRTHRFTAVHAHVQLFSGWLLRLAHLEKIPIRIAHFHSSRDNHGGGLRRTCQRHVMRFWIDKHATDIVAVSGATMAAAWDPAWQSDPRCRVIYTAIDSGRFRRDVNRAAVRAQLGLDARSTLVVHVGSQQEAKNHRRVIEIFAAMARRDANARLVLLGRPDPGVEPRLRQRARDLGVSDRVTFGGERSDVPDIMRAADVMVFPSIWEGLPGSVLEACAAGLPVVATDAPFMHEIAADFSSVRCVPLAATDDEWAAAAESLVGVSTGVRTRYQDEGASWFSMTRYAGEWREVWSRA